MKGNIWGVILGGVILLLGAYWIASPFLGDSTAGNNYNKAEVEDYKTPIKQEEGIKETHPVIATPDCHPSYKGACLRPDASDYDCAGGSGNGPYYTGRVQVVGPDVFGLDRDGDGWGCQ